jgi:hypothetical protein
MEQIPRLTRHERKVLLRIPGLFPDGDSADLKIPGVSPEAISYVMKHLIGLGLVSASSHQGVHPLAPYYRDVELTTEGEELRRDLARWRLVQWFDREWKWVLPNLIALCALAMSLWNFFHAPAK